MLIPRERERVAFLIHCKHLQHFATSFLKVRTQQIASNGINMYQIAICYILTERERLASDLEPKCPLLQESRDGNTGDNPLTFWQRFTTPLTVLT